MHVSSINVHGLAATADDVSIDSTDGFAWLSIGPVTFFPKGHTTTAELTELRNLGLLVTHLAEERLVEISPPTSHPPEPEQDTIQITVPRRWAEDMSYHGEYLFTEEEDDLTVFEAVCEAVEDSRD